MGRNLGRWRGADAVGTKCTPVRLSPDALCPAPLRRRVHVHIHGQTHDAGSRPPGLRLNGSARDQNGNEYQLKLWGPGPRQPDERRDDGDYSMRKDGPDAPGATTDAIGRWVRAPRWHNHPSALADYQERINQFYRRD